MPRSICTVTSLPTKGTEDGHASDLPTALHEPAALFGRTAYVVLLDGHRVGRAGRNHALEVGLHVGNAVRTQVARVVRKPIERGPTYDRALRFCRAQVRVGDRDDREVGTENEAARRASLEEPLEVFRVDRRSAYNAEASTLQPDAVASRNATSAGKMLAEDEELVSVRAKHLACRPAWSFQRKPDREWSFEFTS